MYRFFWVTLYISEIRPGGRCGAARSRFCRQQLCYPFLLDAVVQFGQISFEMYTNQLGILDKYISEIRCRGLVAARSTFCRRRRSTFYSMPRFSIDISAKTTVVIILGDFWRCKKEREDTALQFIFELPRHQIEASYTIAPWGQTTIYQQVRKSLSNCQIMPEMLKNDQTGDLAIEMI